jgi:hypothetical protein
MIKRLILAAAACAALTGASFAQDKPAAEEQPAAEAPADPAVEVCLQKAFELAQSAEQKKLTDGDLDQLEQMLSKMEAHCDAKEQADADKVGGEIQAMLDSKQ